MQAAELLFGADALPHDYLHEALFRILAVGWLGAATSFLVNKASAKSVQPHEAQEKLLISLLALQPWGISLVSTPGQASRPVLP